MTPRSGHPKILSERDKRHLNRLADNDPESTISGITEASGVPVSDRTVGNFLRSEGWYVHFARKKPWLKPDQKPRRRLWCAERGHSSKERCRKRIFTDESGVQIGKGGQRKKVRRKAGVELAYQDRYLEPTFRSGTFTVQFWGAVTYGSHSPLTVVPCRTPEERVNKQDKLGMNAQQYTTEILETKLLPFMQQLPDSLEDYKTIEDGHCAHTSELPNSWRRHHHIKRSDWPPSSPNLNIIENVWSMLKARMKKRMRDPQKRPTNADELAEQAKEEWEKLDWEKIYKFIDSMPRRVRAVIKNKGSHTRW